MQRLCSILLAGCFLFNTVSVSSFAQGTNSRRNCDVHAMLNSSDNEQWSNANCLKAVTSYLSKKSSAQVKQECGNVCSNASNRLAKHIKELLKQGKERRARVYENLLLAFNKAANLSFKWECVDVHGKTVPCPESNGIHDKVTKKIKPKVPPNQTPPNPEESGNTTIVGPVDFCFGNDSKDSDLTNKIARLAAMDKDALYSALSVLVSGGSASPKDPAYVHPVILNAAFFLYAKKITAAEQRHIEQYLNPREVDPGIDSKYASNVQLAAANALFAFAKKNPQSIASKFSLSSSYGTVKNTLSASGVMVGALSISASLSLWDVLAAELAAAGGEIAASVAEFTAAMEAAAASAAHAGTAVVSSASLGATVVFVAGSACFVYALNDAYSSGYKAAFNRARETFWTEVFSLPDYSGLDERIFRVIPTDWSAEFAKYGAADATAANTATCIPKRPETDCKQINMKQVKSYFSSPESPVRVGELNAHLRGIFGNDFTKSTTIGELLPHFPKGDPIGELFNFIANNCDSFTNSKGGTAFPKLIKNEKSFTAEIEVGVNIGNTPLTKVLSDGIIAALCLDNAFLNERIDLGNGRRIRNTEEHERNGNHFHYEDGQCNHSINFTGASFIDQMRKICAARP